MIRRNTYLAAVQTVKKYHLQEKKKRNANKTGPTIWKAKTDLFMSVSGDMVFKKGEEYDEVQKTFTKGDIVVIDERGDNHIIFSKGELEMEEFIKNFTKIN